jgi:hypothetical protein
VDDVTQAWLGALLEEASRHWAAEYDPAGEHFGDLEDLVGIVVQEADSRIWGELCRRPRAIELLRLISPIGRFDHLATNHRGPLAIAFHIVDDDHVAWLRTELVVSLESDGSPTN